MSQEKLTTYSIGKLLDFKNKFALEVGVFQEDNERKDDEEQEQVVNNATILFFMENGVHFPNSDQLRVPARPILQRAVDHWYKEMAKPALSACIYKYLQSGGDVKEFEKELSRWGIRLENWVRKYIQRDESDFVRNAESTQKAKGFDHPLFHTGQLMRAITTRVVTLQ